VVAIATNYNKLTEAKSMSSETKMHTKDSSSFGMALYDLHRDSQDNCNFCHLSEQFHAISRTKWARTSL